MSIPLLSAIGSYLPSAVASTIGSSIYSGLTKHKKLIVPLDNPYNFKIMSKSDIKNEFCKQKFKTNKVYNTKKNMRNRSSSY